MGFFENEKEFRNRAVRQKLSTACQAAFYAIIGKFNDANWAEEIELTDSELMRLTQIRSTKTIADVKSRLKLSGIIDFRTSKHYGTTYKLVQLASTAWSEQQGKVHSKVQPKQQGKVQTEAPLIKYTLNSTVQEDVKTEDGGTHARERTAPATDDSEKYCSSVIKNAWITNSGMNPNDGICMKLGMLEQNFGTEKVKVAIEEANARNQSGTINFNFVQSVLMRMINGTLTKGEMPSGKITRNDRKSEKDYDWDKNMPDLSKYEV